MKLTIVLWIILGVKISVLAGGASDLPLYFANARTNDKIDTKSITFLPQYTLYTW